MPRRAIENSDAPGLPLSAAVHGGDLLFVSGQIGVDPATGRLVDGGARGQTERVLRNIESVLALAGKTLDDVVKANVYLASMEDFSAMNEVFAKAFRAPYPARTTVAVAALPFGARVEIEVAAR